MGSSIGRLQEVVIDCLDPAGLARFYGELLGLDPETRGDDWAFVEGETSQIRVAFQRVRERKVMKNRLHLDIEIADLAAATAACVALGATVLGGVVSDDQGSFQVMADPEQNEFCLVR